MRTHSASHGLRASWTAILTAFGALVAPGLLGYCWTLRRQLSQALREREDERRGRISAEKESRRQVQERQNREGYLLRAVATVRTCFPDRRGAPRQPTLCPSTRGRVELAPDVPSAAFEGLEDFSHAILLYVFHENTNMHKEGRNQTVKAKISPPQLAGARVGVYSTRTPHRINPIGLSVVEIASLDLSRRCINVRGLDLVDGTPLLDLKPYLPFDRIPDNLLRVPSWISDNEEFRPRRVEFADSVRQETRRAAAEGRLNIYDGATDLLQAAEEVLALDIRGVHQGRGKATGKGVPYLLRLDVFTFTFYTTDRAVLVFKAECSQG